MDARRGLASAVVIVVALIACSSRLAEPGSSPVGPPHRAEVVTLTQQQASQPDPSTTANSITFPGPATFVPTPVGRRGLSSRETLSIARRANTELRVPGDTVAIHGVFTDPANEPTPVWAFRYHSCVAPHAPTRTANSLCTRWVFLQSQDGSFVEARSSA